jgi:ADP-ribose pyrophosphatase YjhB (NUDIX family)
MLENLPSLYINYRLFPLLERNRLSYMASVMYCLMAQLLCDLGVAARVVRDGKILLVQEANGRHKDRWGLPKGHVEPGESPEAAALRELVEETGLDGTVIGLAGVRTALRTDGPAVFLCYEVDAHKGRLGAGSDEISSVSWFSLSDLTALEWVSETMHQLAIDGLTHHVVTLHQKGLTPRGGPYAVYRSGLSRTRGSQR